MHDGPKIVQVARKWVQVGTKWKPHFCNFSLVFVEYNTTQFLKTGLYSSTGKRTTNNDHFGSKWGHLEVILAASWGIRARFGSFLGGSGGHLASKVACLGTSWLQIGGSWSDFGSKIGSSGQFSLLQIHAIF